MGPIIKTGGGFSKGLKGFLDGSFEEGDEGFGFLASEGEKRS